jgi:hypothetical protein
MTSTSVRTKDDDQLRARSFGLFEELQFLDSLLILLSAVFTET